MKCSIFYGDVDSGRKTNPLRPCTACGKPIGPRRRRWCSDKCASEFSANHSFSFAREMVKKKVYVRGKGWKCALCGIIVYEVDVDHIEQAWGRHAKYDCIHHLENLQVLCKPCHKEKTRVQLRENKGKKRVVNE